MKTMTPLFLRMDLPESRLMRHNDDWRVRLICWCWRGGVNWLVFRMMVKEAVRFLKRRCRHRLDFTTVQRDCISSQIPDTDDRTAGFTMMRKAAWLKMDFSGFYWSSFTSPDPSHFVVKITEHNDWNTIACDARSKIQSWASWRKPS